MRLEHDCVLLCLDHVVAYHRRESIILSLEKLRVVDGQLGNIDVSYGLHISGGFVIAKVYMRFWNMMDRF